MVSCVSCRSFVARPRSKFMKLFNGTAKRRAGGSSARFIFLSAFWSGRRYDGSTFRIIIRSSTFLVLLNIISQTRRIQFEYFSGSIHFRSDVHREEVQISFISTLHFSRLYFPRLQFCQTNYDLIFLNTICQF